MPPKDIFPSGSDTETKARQKPQVPMIDTQMKSTRWTKQPPGVAKITMEAYSLGSRVPLRMYSYPFPEFQSVW
ncbi:hypothetical protein JCM33374_g4940 [Metschnikowia sp. JCM 33374]|nr:hypothetical protein JCM33374_g4940 [Metschnikowia sp. JCM 33374]